MAQRVYLFAFDNTWRVVDVEHLENEAISVRNIRRLAEWITDIYPEPVTVYAVNDRPGLRKELMESARTRDFTIHVEFADTISREGILIRV